MADWLQLTDRVWLLAADGCRCYVWRGICGPVFLWRVWQGQHVVAHGSAETLWSAQEQAAGYAARRA